MNFSYPWGGSLVLIAEWLVIKEMYRPLLNEFHQ